MEEHSPKFLFPFCSLAAADLDGASFSIGALVRSGLSVTWLSQLQIGLWHRFVELLKSTKNDGHVRCMMAHHLEHMTLQMFKPEPSDFPSFGYEYKMLIDMNILATSLLCQDGDLPKHETFCYAAFSNFHALSIQLSVAFTHNSTLKGLWAKVVQGSRNVMEGRQLLSLFEGVMNHLDAVNVLTSPSEISEALKEFEQKAPRGLASLRESLQKSGNATQASVLQSRLDATTEQIGSHDVCKLRDFFTLLWVTELSAETPFADCVKFEILEAEMVTLQSVATAGIVSKSCLRRLNQSFN